MGRVKRLQLEALQTRRDLWLKLGFDSVDAQLRQGCIGLPRIPRIPERLGLDAYFGGLGDRESH